MQSTRKLEVNGSERKSRACTESHDSRQDDVFHEVVGRASTHRTRSWRSTRSFTTIKSNEMEPACVEKMKGTEKEVEMGTKDSNGLQINI